MADIIKTRCAIAGGGPAGMMLGFLLARAGIDTVVLEKWPDFFRDFRGDTIHPSTMTILKELGLLEEFLQLPHSKTYQMTAKINRQSVAIADFEKLRVPCPFIAFMPQWDFLNFIAKQAKRYPHFHLMMDTTATDIIKNDHCVSGITAKRHEKSFAIHADLVIAADGRHSTIREKSGFTLETLSAPIDVLWFKLPRKPHDPKQSLGEINDGKMMVMLERGDYWQCGFIIKKNQYQTMMQQDITHFHQAITAMNASLEESIKTITDWQQIKLLQVTVNRLKQWYKPGVLCIGDAAHAMSPIGGVGINLAIQDAVSSANYLIPAFQHGAPNEMHLKKIQQRRAFPTRFIQRMQVILQNRVTERVLGHAKPMKLPFALKLLQRLPILRKMVAYVIGIGVRPEHVRRHDGR